MADLHEARLSKDNDINEVTSKETGVRTIQELELDNTVRGMTSTPSTSRFHVARVDDEKVEEDELPPDPEPATGKPAKQIDFQFPDSPKSPKSPYDSVHFFGGTVSPNDTYGYNNSYETHMKTFGKNTVEAIPHVDHYRNLLSATAALKSRPTLAELHEEKEEENIRAKQREPLLASDENLADESTNKANSAIKFGWIKGVLVRCLLNIWGVMLFMRMSWVVGQAGIGLSTVIVLLATVVTVITSISMTAICTNGEVKGGGAYYMISRSLGPEFGGAIGLIFSVANAVAVAMYVVGFSETVRDILKANDALMVDEVNDIRIIGVLTVTLLLAIAIIGMEWEARAQVVLLGALLIAIINFVIGTFIPPSDEKMLNGVVGYQGTVFVDNFGPKYTEGENFFSVFAIFFPAATGILAGANISGDLKNAQRDIPQGTFLAIIISSITYIVCAWLLGSCILREASGYVPVAVLASNATQNMTLEFVSVTQGLVNSTILNPNAGVSIMSLAQNCSLGKGGVCTRGLLYDFQAMELVSGWGPLLTVGIFSATLSSALASLVSAPKVFQAVCKDRIFPKIHVFAKGYGASENPRRAYILAYFIGVAFICIGDLNAIAPIISNFFLMSYALINYSCFDASLANSPGWRPAFRYYSMWLSLLGALLCIAVMFIMNWWTALITFVIICALFVYVHYSKPDVNWGSSTQAHVYKNALNTTLKLVSVEDHIKNFRPQVLVLTGVPWARPGLVDFVYGLTHKISLMVCGNIIVGSQTDNLKHLRPKEAYHWLHNRRVKGFYSVTTAENFRTGAQSLMQNVGVGKLKPNILLMGFMSRWNNPEVNQALVEEYFHVVHDAFDLEYGVGILRLREGLYCETDAKESLIEDNSVHHKADPDDEEEDKRPSSPSSPTMLRRSSSSSGDSVADDNGNNGIMHIEREIGPSGIKQEQVRNRFAKKQKKGTIDVWWLFDDGGLTLLLPYILSTKQYWRNCPLRVFAAGTKRGEIDREQRQMATLLSRFRIQCEKMTILSDIGKSPSEESMKNFEKLLEGWMLDEEKGETSEKFPWKITEEQKLLLKDKTKRNIRLRELLLQHSKDAALIVMTLPMPRKSTCPAGLFMAWLETLTKDLPPILLLRGNQSSVLTFYS
ncbi:solute carrier family 12 member 3-like isoform X2 [Ostrea edulis]|uniref:solute carrier family 12 member 3-like isoform X2 n=1 Tax=Ostrea edulis TaxID=37623 RepID=UPI002094E20F|nr:solute carrier family 12 member 3-like isoform X2 [Ostrea edulis]